MKAPWEEIQSIWKLNIYPIWEKIVYNTKFESVEGDIPCNHICNLAMETTYRKRYLIKNVRYIKEKVKGLQYFKFNIL